jgi:hypothetical protein
MKPETLVKLSVALLSEAEHEFRYKANAILVESFNLPRSLEREDEYDNLLVKAETVLEVLNKLNKI